MDVGVRMIMQKILIYPYNASDLGASIFSCVNGE